MPTQDNSIQDNRRSQRAAGRLLTPEQMAALRALALAWRDEWRAEVAARAGKANGHAIKAPAAAPHRTKSEKAAAAQFATAVARNEFGRFYWSDKLQGAMSESLKGEGRKGKSRKHRPE
jgi:hypothetical protein